MEKQPKKRPTDYAYGLAKALVSSVPVAGSPAAVVLDEFLGPPLERRRNQWLDSLAETIQEIKDEKGRSVEELRDDPAFISIVCRATRASLVTHEKEKLEALRQAIANSAEPAPSYEYDKRQLFLHLVDILTVTHLRSLKALADPGSCLKEKGLDLTEDVAASLGNGYKLLQILVPGLEGRREMAGQVLAELQQNGLLGRRTNGPNWNLGTQRHHRGDLTYAPPVSYLGIEFLDFIGVPIKRPTPLRAGSPPSFYMGRIQPRRPQGTRDEARSEPASGPARSPEGRNSAR